MNNSILKPRLMYIDIARGIAILFVIIGHMNQFYRDNLGMPHPKMLAFIYTFHMPLFFIISGILFSEKSFRETSFSKFLIKKIKSLIVPYLFLDITGGIYNVLSSSLVNFSAIKMVVINTLTFHNNIGADWFLFALFIGELGLYLFLRYYRPIYKYFVWIPFFLIDIYYPFSIYWINVTVRGIIAFTFILLGYLFKEYYKNDINKRWDAIILSFFLTYSVSIFNGQIDIWGGSIGSPVLCLVGGLAGAYCIIGVSKNITSRMLVFIGQNSVTMMGTHMIIIVLIWSLLTKTVFVLLPTWMYNAYGAILFFALVVITNLPIMYLYNRFLPFLIGKSK